MMQIRSSRALLPGLVALAAVATYANSLLNRFAYDDVSIITDDRRVHGLGHLVAVLTGPYWAFTRQLGLYRPLTTLSFALEWTLSGGAPWLYHGVNVALHAVVCVLLYFMLDRLAGRVPALVGALLFAVHPVHTEVVANVVGQAELLAAVGILGTCLLWLRQPADAAPRPGTIAGLAGLYALALFAKESAIVGPGLLVLLDMAQRRLEPTRRGLAAYTRRIAPAMAAFAGVAGAYLVARYYVIGSIAGEEVAPALPFLAQDHVWMGLRAWPEYLRLLFFPQDLSADYSPGVILPVHGWTTATAAGAGLMAAVTALALVTPARPRLGMPAAWFLLSIIIVSNLFFPIGVVLAERTLYLPSVALALALAFAWTPLAGRYPVRALAVLAALVLLALAARTWTRNPDWRDQDAVVGALVRDHPESGRTQWFLAFSNAEKGDSAAAERAWELAYRLWPENSQLLNEFAMFTIARGRPHRALAILRQAEAIHPNDARSRVVLGTALLTLGRYREALAVGQQLAATLPNAPEVNDIRARAYMGLGDFPSAVAAWRRVVARNKASWIQWSGLGRSLAHAGDYPAALAALDSAQRRAGKDTSALRQIAGYRLLTSREMAAAGAGTAPARPGGRAP